MKSTTPREFPGIATVLGFQDDFSGGGFWLFNLDIDIDGHCKGSTVAEQTIVAWLDSRKES